jgi:hypothetical protein
MKQLSIVSRTPYPKINRPGERSLLEGIRKSVSQLSPEEVHAYLSQRPQKEAEPAARKRAERNARARAARRIKKAEKAKR